MFEDPNLETLAKQAKSFLREAKVGIVAGAVMAFGAVRQYFEEKVEPVLAESEELLFHVAPQLAAFA